MKRPLLWALCVLIIGMVMVYYDFPLFSLLLLPCLFLPLPLVVNSIKWSQVFFVLALYFMGIFSAFHTFEMPTISEVYGNRECQIEGVISEITLKENGGIRFQLELKSVDNTKISGKIEGTIGDNQVDLKIRNQVCFKGKITAPAGRRNPGGFDYALYLKAQGVSGQVFLKNSKILEIVGEEKTGSIDKIHQVLAKTCDTFLKSDESGLVKGLLFGSKDVTREVKDNFRNAGVSHILAVSGLHVGYVYALVLFVLGFFKVKKKSQIFFLVPFLLFYVALTGFSPTVIRAAVMLSVLVLGQGIEEEYDGVNGLCLATLCILMIKPIQLFMAGFQLSFCAVLGILLFYKPLMRLYEKNIRKPGMIISSLCITICSTIGTLPASLYHFHTINFISLASNLLIVPLAGVLLVMSFVGIPIITFFPIMGNILGLPLAFLADGMLALTEFFSQFHFLLIQRGGLSLLEMALLFILSFLVSGYFNFRKKNIRRFIIITISMICILLGVGNLIPRQLTVTFLDVGQGDSALIQTPKGGAYLIDGGGFYTYGTDQKKERTLISEQVLLPALYAKNIMHLDGVFITHNHVDHSQGIEEILSKIPVDRLFVNTKYNNEGLLKQSKIPVSVLSQGKSFSTEDGLSMTVYWPDEKVEALPENEQNDHSTVLRLVYREASILMMGDSGFAVEDMIVTEMPESDVIKIGHHGSKYSSSEAFLKKVAPKLAIISVGQYNYFGHPTEETLKNIENAGAKCYRTDENGAVELRTNGKQLKIKTYLEPVK
ncbi:MAG: DNA internalization-related competence protein ComEC/Rec2 [Eubacterium sp.]